MVEDRYARVVELVRSVRHDANNPLTAALGHVQLLLEEPGQRDAEALEVLGVVEAELRRLTAILRRLNDVRIDER